jgi:hypothetical protein
VIKFVNDSESNIVTFNLHDTRISKPGTFTDDFDWRYNLKEGDLIDCMDTERVWYISTVLKVREVEIEEGVK